MAYSTPASVAVKIHVYSHCIVLSGYTHQIKNHLVDLCRLNAQMGMERVGRNRYEKRMKKIFASTTRTRDEFRFHRNQLSHVLDFLANRGISRDRMELVFQPIYTPTPIEINYTSDKLPRDYQITQIGYLMEPPAEGYAPSKVITLQTGKGKGVISIKALCDIGQRTLIVLKPMYIQKWINELLELTDLKLEDIMVISGKVEGSDGVTRTANGGAMFKALLKQAAENRLDCKVVILSNVIYADYLDAYNTQMAGGFDYAVTPVELCEKLGVGVRLIDEVHQDFHRNFRFDLFTHVPVTHSMSATLDHDDRFMNERYRIMWPLAVMPPEMEYDAFIECQSLLYTINKPHLIRCTGFAKSYSHIKFEESILRSKEMTRNYMAMIIGVLEEVYLQDRQPKQSAIIFCATVTMCTLVQQAIQRKYPDIHVERYVSQDSYEENFLAPEIVVSTIGSAGTAVDKPNLRETIMTNALNSKQANVQVLGRTRRLKDYPDRAPRFHFLSCREIPKHMEYARAKYEKFQGKVAGFRTVQTPYRI